MKSASSPIGEVASCVLANKMYRHLVLLVVFLAYFISSSNGFVTQGSRRTSSQVVASSRFHPVAKQCRHDVGRGRPSRSTIGTSVASGADADSKESHPVLLNSSNDPQQIQTNAPPPVLNGKRVLPFQIMIGGLQAHKLYAVYAVLNDRYKRGTEGWDCCEYVGRTSDLEVSLQAHRKKHGESNVAHVRALSFTFPQENAMQDVVNEWRDKVVQAGGSLTTNWDLDCWSEDAYDEDDDDDDDDDDWNMEMAAQAMMSARAVTIPDSDGSINDNNGNNNMITSPFAVTPSDGVIVNHDASGDELAFTKENVDRVLEEVRPYLIADGGNVAVEAVDIEKRNVFLKLQGACGSCPSSTVTMQLGVERLLKEKFPNLGQVLQVQDDVAALSTTELTWEAVDKEVNRIKPAITAMGGIVDIVKVDPNFGVVDLKFRGSNKIRQGLELAILDVPFVRHVNFVMGDD